MDKYLVRTAKAGVFYGEIEEYNTDYIKMKNVRKLWSWSGAGSIEQLAIEGVKEPHKCKFTVAVASMWIAEPVQIIEATKAAQKTFDAVKVWKV